MASLMWGYYSLIIRASQFSSTTRNLVPRFKRWSKGGRFRNEYSGSSHPGVLFSKRSIQYIDAFLLLLQVKMMKSSSFLRDLHRTYEKDMGEDSGRAGLTRLTIWYITQGMG